MQGRMRPLVQTECIKSLIKLKRQEEGIEKTLDHFLDNMKLEPETLRVMKNERFSRMLERRKLTNSLRTAMLDIANSLKEVKLSIGEMQEGRKIDVVNFKEKLISLANKIREFKKDSSLDILKNEENELEQNMHVSSFALSKFETRTSSENKKSTQNVVVDFYDYRGVKDFDALIAKTGHTYNWSDADHLFFLKVRKNCENVPSIVAAIRKKCPDLTPESIVNHEAWYKIYLDLREKQRKSIRDWREKKNLEKRGINEKNEDGKKIEENIGKHGSIARKLDQRIVSRNNVKIELIKDEPTCDKRALLKQWQDEKEKVHSLETEPSTLEVKSRRAYNENHRFAKGAKSEVIAYKEKKIENATSSSTSVTDTESMASKSGVVKSINCFRQRDEEFLKRRKDMLRTKKSCPNGVLCQKIHSRRSDIGTLAESRT